MSLFLDWVLIQQFSLFWLVPWPISNVQWASLSLFSVVSCRARLQYWQPPPLQDSLTPWGFHSISAETLDKQIFTKLDKVALLVTYSHHGAWELACKTNKKAWFGFFKQAGGPGLCFMLHWKYIHCRIKSWKKICSKKRIFKIWTIFPCLLKEIFINIYIKDRSKRLNSSKKEFKFCRISWKQGSQVHIIVQLCPNSVQHLE